MTLVIKQDTPDNAVIDQIEASLVAFNFAAVGMHDREVLLLTGRDENGQLQAGLKGLMGWNWLFVSMLWVCEDYRGQGYGSALLLQAEESAKAHGCSNVFLDTHSFQAPGFYEKHGYKEFGRLENFPPGHARIYYTKAL